MSALEQPLTLLVMTAALLVVAIDAEGRALHGCKCSRHQPCDMLLPMTYISILFRAFDQQTAVNSSTLSEPAFVAL
jgi:hypothetical protein